MALRDGARDHSADGPMVPVPPVAPGRPRRPVRPWHRRSSPCASGTGWTVDRGPGPAVPTAPVPPGSGCSLWRRRSRRPGGGVTVDRRPSRERWTASAVAPSEPVAQLGPTQPAHLGPAGPVAPGPGFRSSPGRDVCPRAVATVGRAPCGPRVPLGPEDRSTPPNGPVGPWNEIPRRARGHRGRRSTGMTCCPWTYGTRGTAIAGGAGGTVEPCSPLSAG